MAKAIDKEFLNYFVRLDASQKKSLLQMVKAFLGNEGQSPSNITIQEYNRELDEAMERMNKGELVSTEDLEKEMITW